MKFSPLVFLSGVLEKLNIFLESRDQRQKSIIVTASFMLLLSADYFVLVRPVLSVFTRTTPELEVQKRALRDLEDDLKNKLKIEKKWEDTRSKLEATEKQFIPQSEVSSILERLSKLAQESQVKIITIKPLETSDAGLGLRKIPIRMSAVAATHDLGHFLSLLEGGAAYFRIADLHIAANASDDHRHTVELSIETYAKIK